MDQDDVEQEAQVALATALGQCGETEPARVMAFLRGRIRNHLSAIAVRGRVGKGDRVRAGPFEPTITDISPASEDEDCGDDESVSFWECIEPESYELPPPVRASWNELLSECRNHLTEQELAVLQLTYEHDGTSEEIAEFLGVTPNAVRMSRKKGLKKLRNVGPTIERFCAERE